MKRKLLLLIILGYSIAGIGQISLVADLVPGTEQSNPIEFIAHDDLLFFIGSNGTGTVIYAIDSSENITTVWSETGSPNNLTVFNNELYFNSNNQVHKLNLPYGTGSTIIDVTISIFGSLFVYNGELYFGGEQNQTDPLNPNYEIMAYNGTVIRLVEDESSISLNPYQFVKHLGELYFFGYDIEFGQTESNISIYKTNGASVEKVYGYSSNYIVSDLTSYNGTLYFMLSQGGFPNPYNLWYLTGGTIAGFGENLNFAFGLTIFDNKLFFYDQDTKSLKYRNTFGNVNSVPIQTGLEYPVLGFPIISNDIMAFSGSTDNLGNELYTYKLNDEIKFTQDYNSGTNGFIPVYGSFFNNKLYISGDDGSGIGRELHVYDPNGCTNTINIEDSNFEAYLENILDVGDGILGNKKVCKEEIEVLTNLDISNLGITDLSGLEFFTALQTLNVSDNNLNSLEIQNLSLREIRANNSNLGGKLIRFQNNPPSGSFLTNVTTLELQSNSIGNSSSTISFGGVPNVINLDISDNNFGTLQLGETLLIESILVSGCSNLSILANLDALTELVTLDASFTNLSNLNLSQNTKLSFLNVAGNALTSLNTASNILLASIYAGDNNLNSINLPSTSTLNELYLENNTLTSLNISKSDQNLVDFSTLGNTSLDCIQVSNVTTANTQSGWLKETETEYNTNCNITTLYTVNTNIQNAGNSPNFIITEGQTFTLNFNADNTAIDGEQYTPNIEFTINGNPSVEDFRFNENETTIPNNPFTVSTANPDGSINILAFNDGTVETDEIYTITITSADPSKYTMAEPTSFNITVKDAPLNNDVLQIGVRLFENNNNDASEALNIPFIISENPDNYIAIAFDALNTNSAELENYTITISTKDGDALSANADYFSRNESLIITTNDEGYDFYDSYKANLSARPDNEIDEIDENYFVEITPSNNLISLVDFSSNPAGEVLNPGETLTLEIVIRNSKTYYGNELVIFDTELTGNFEFENNVYNVNEGETLRLEFNAQSPNEVEGFEFPIEFNVLNENATLNQDYEISTQSPILISVDNISSPDNFLEINIKNDSFNDPDEFIEIYLPGNQFSSGRYVFEDYVPNTEYYGKTFRIKINNVAQNNTILAKLVNTGGTEGNGIEAGRDGETENGIGLDTFTLSLKNSDGSEYKTTQQLTFPITFSPDESVSEGLKAEKNDFEASIPSQIIIPKGSSKGSIIVRLPQEEVENNEHELYIATVSSPNEEINVSLPPPLQAKIIDDEGIFKVFLQLATEGLMKLDDSGAGDCCPFYVVEEGTSLLYTFNAEKGVVNGEEYKVILEYPKSDISDYPTAVTTFAEETKDYFTVATNPLQRNFILSVKDDFLETTSGTNPNPDNKLSVKVRNDDEKNEGSEKFNISIKATDNAKFILTNSNIHSNNFQIIEAVPASLIIQNDTADEENATIDKGIFIIRLDEAAEREVEVTYSIEGDAVNGEDYKRITGSVVFSSGDLEKTIEIEALPDDIPEDEKTIVITLIDGQGYSINTDNNRGAIKIPKNDQDKIKFEVTLTAINNQIFENPENNIGVFEVQITPPNTSGIDLSIHYSFINDNETYPALEGSDNDFTQDGTGILLFKSGESNIKTIKVTALTDPETGIEEPEIITLQLDEGDRYSAAQTAKAKIEIVSTEFDTNNLSNTALQVSVSTNTCANTNEGDITIKNNSGFDFTASIIGQDKNLKIGRNKEETFKNLPSGRHLVTFSFVDETKDIIPPSFEVFIAELNGMNLAGKQVNLTSRTANLKVSGSKKYTVINGTNEYSFEFNSYLENNISIPVSDGINNIKIKGEAACQGIIETKIYLNKVIVYPNPTERILTFSGFLLEEEATIHITNIYGKILYINTLHIYNGYIQVNISGYATGLYYGTIKTKSGQDLKFKILKD